jgi:hypothetical protein
MNKISFVNFNPKGLKPLVDQFKKNYELPVADIAATNMPKREDGFQIKAATLTFESGQKLAIKIKANGSIFQVRLNGKVVPIKNSEDLHVPKNFKAAIKEMADFIKKNEAGYAKQKQKRLGKDTGAGKKQRSVSVSVSKQLYLKKTLLEELKGETQGLEQDLEKGRYGIGEGQTTQSSLKGELEAEQRRNESLRAEINELLEAA